MRDAYSIDSDGRIWLDASYSIRHVRVQDPLFRRLLRERPYHGQVLVQIPGFRPCRMYHRQDDIVSGICHYFGPFAYESLSAIVFSCLATECQHVIDVGAHTGFYSLVAASANADAQVTSFEIMHTTAHRARENVELSGLGDRVKVLGVGISSKEGRLELHYNSEIAFETGPSLEVIDDRVRRKGAASAVVDVTTIDSWWRTAGKPRVGLVKIDVEKHESAVVAGGQSMLRDCRPAIISEVLSRSDVVTMFECLAPLGYDHGYVLDDDTMQVHGLDASLHYWNGRPYKYFRYHNVLFTCGELPRSSLARIGAHVRLAGQGPSVVGSGRWMAKRLGQARSSRVEDEP